MEIAAVFAVFCFFVLFSASCPRYAAVATKLTPCVACFASILLSQTIRPQGGTVKRNVLPVNKPVIKKVKTNGRKITLLSQI